MNNPPTVSVITAVYNGERFLTQAIESVLAQTFQDFELILVDDASTDGTPQILARYAANEKVILLRNPANQERSASRNRAIERATGRYIAILDADDICLPERLEKQVRFLEAHPQVDVLGGALAFIDEQSRPLLREHHPLRTHAEIAWATLFVTPIAHSTAMLCATKMKAVGGYDPRWPPCEDVDLWIRLVKAGARFANLPQPLAQYRTSVRQQQAFTRSLPLAWEIRRLFLAELLGREIPAEAYEQLLLSLQADRAAELDTPQLARVVNLLYAAFYALKQRSYLGDGSLAPAYDDLLQKNARLLAHTPGLEASIHQKYLQKLPARQWLRLFWHYKKGYLRLPRRR